MKIARIALLFLGAAAAGWGGQRAWHGAATGPAAPSPPVVRVPLEKPLPALLAAHDDIALLRSLASTNLDAQADSGSLLHALHDALGEATATAYAWQWVERDAAGFLRALAQNELAEDIRDQRNDLLAAAYNHIAAEDPALAWSLAGGLAKDLRHEAYTPLCLWLLAHNPAFLATCLQSPVPDLAGMEIIPTDLPVGEELRRLTALPQNGITDRWLKDRFRHLSGDGPEKLGEGVRWLLTAPPALRERFLPDLIDSIRTVPDNFAQLSPADQRMLREAMEQEPPLPGAAAALVSLTSLTDPAESLLLARERLTGRERYFAIEEAIETLAAKAPAEALAAWEALPPGRLRNDTAELLVGTLDRQTRAAWLLSLPEGDSARNAGAACVAYKSLDEARKFAETSPPGSLNAAFFSAVAEIPREPEVLEWLLARRGTDPVDDGINVFYNNWSVNDSAGAAAATASAAALTDPALRARVLETTGTTWMKTDLDAFTEWAATTSPADRLLLLRAAENERLTPAHLEKLRSRLAPSDPE